MTKEKLSSISSAQMEGGYGEHGRFLSNVPLLIKLNSPNNKSNIHSYREIYYKSKRPLYSIPPPPNSEHIPRYIYIIGHGSSGMRAKGL